MVVTFTGTFDLEDGVDVLYLFEGVDNTGSQIGAFTGQALPSAATSTTNQVYISLFTDGSGNGMGFTATVTFQ